MIINSGYDVENSGTLPIGPLSIVASLEAGGFAVDFRDYQLHPAPDKPSPDTFCDFIDCDTPIIGMNIMCGNLPTVLMGIQRLKERHPEKTIILGGPSASDSPDYILRHFPVDIIVRGEGELTALELLQVLETRGDLGRVLGISYRRDSQVCHNPPRPRVEELDTLPWPAYNRVDFEQYRGRAMIATARGCPYHCEFCSAHSVWRHRVTYRSPASVAMELASLQHRVRLIEFCDDTFVLNPRRVREIIAAVRGAGIHLPIRCNGRINLMTRDLLQDLAEGGFDYIFYGIESGSNRVLKHLRKEFTIEQARTVIGWSLEYLPQVHTTYIWGFPFESQDDFYDTIAAIAEDSRSPKVSIQTYLLSALVASPLYAKYRALLKFEPALQFGISVLATGNLINHPELVDFIKKHPELCASFYYYDHPLLEAKLQAMRRLGAGFTRLQAR